MAKYNAIVVGAGAAGAPLAARLSEDPGRTVLLVEAGPDYARTEDFPADLLNAGLATGFMPGHPNNWAFVANLTPQLPYSVARGKILKRLAELDDTTLNDDAALNAWMRSHLATAIHAAGSCKMGSNPAAGAVVDQYGRVHGVTGVRVADTSILPFAPSRGPAATTIMIGERVADLIRRRVDADSIEAPLPTNRVVAARP